MGGDEVLRPGGFDGELDLSDSRSASSSSRSFLRVRVSVIARSEGLDVADCLDVADESNLTDSAASCSSLAVGALSAKEPIASTLPPVSAPSTEDIAQTQSHALEPSLVSHDREHEASRLDSRSLPRLGQLAQDVHSFRAGIGSDMQVHDDLSVSAAHTSRRGTY